MKTRTPRAPDLTAARSCDLLAALDGRFVARLLSGETLSAIAAAEGLDDEFVLQRFRVGSVQRQLNDALSARTVEADRERLEQIATGAEGAGI